MDEGQPFGLRAQAAATGTALDFSGSVEAFADGTSLGTATVDPVTGMAEFLSITLPVGTHMITATYTGDSATAGSNARA